MLRLFLYFLALSAAGLFAALTPSKARAEGAQFTLYLDADFSIMPASAEAIEMGIRAAFVGTWAETGVVILPKDHRANARRSLQTFQIAWQDPSALAVLGGMHSPPYFANGDQINANRMPLLLPWSAGGMLTRLAEGDENWIFRLSVDDTKAALKLARFGWNSGCRKTALMYVDGPWGHSNAKRLREKIESLGGTVTSSRPLPFNGGLQFAQAEVKAVQQEGAECVVLVSGLALGTNVIKALGELEMPPRLISHWGILGNRLTDTIPIETLRKVRLAILGTCGLVREKSNLAVYERAREKAKQVSGGTFDPAAHPAPHGFYHAYDFGLLLLAAIETAQQTEAWAQGPQARRAALRTALYAQRDPLLGLLKTYSSPFEPVTVAAPDGHEALGSDDLCMTSVDPDGNIIDLVRD